MKIEAQTLEVTRSGTFKERGFGIANNAQAFDILSSKIYTDVPLAIVRELSTNASDSHTDAGCPNKPFDVHLPNALEPWLTIRDYGTGLSPTDVEEVYTTYFKSTRSSSDDFTGCLGLGSKSPFAYTDQFTIVSRWNGKLYTYSAFKNESGCPSLALLSELDTDESNGLEIRIAIKAGDSHRFVNAAQRVYAFFKVRPNIKGAALSFDDNKPEISCDDYSLFNSHMPNKVSVVMGQVCYAANNYKINTPFGHAARVILHMPMGSCSISASREELHYDDKTLNHVDAALKTAIDHARVELESRLDNKESVFSRLSQLARYRDMVPGMSVVGCHFIVSKEQDKYAVKRCSIRRGDKLFIDHYCGEFRGGEYAERTIFVEEDVDLSQNMKNRLRQFIKSLQKTQVYLATIEDMARFTELFGDVYTKLSLLPDVPRVARSSNKATSRAKPIKLLNKDYSGPLGSEWENIHISTDVDATDACCVPRDGNWAIWKESKVRPNTVRSIAEPLGFKRVYGISAKRYDSLRVKYNIPDLATVAEDRAKRMVAGLDKYALASFQWGSRGYEKYLKNLPLGISTECDDFVKVLNSKISDMEMYYSVCSQFGISIPVATNYKEMFFKKYPILLAIDQYSGMITEEIIVDYIKMVEATKEKN